MPTNEIVALRPYAFFKFCYENSATIGTALTLPAISNGKTFEKMQADVTDENSARQRVFGYGARECVSAILQP